MAKARKPIRRRLLAFRETERDPSSTSVGLSDEERDPIGQLVRAAGTSLRRASRLLGVGAMAAVAACPVARIGSPRANPASPGGRQVTTRCVRFRAI